MRVLAALLVLALLAPAALAQDAAPRVRTASLLVYHPWPDPRAGEPDADATGSPLAPPPEGLGPGETLLDGIARASAAPEGAPESALAHFRELQRLFLQRERTGAPVAISLGGTLADSELRFDASARATGRLPEGPLTLSFVVFENGVPATTLDGIRAQPYVARAALAPQPLDFVEGRAGADGNVALDPAWDRARLGVVALVRAPDGEVLQSAAWLARSGARVEQTTKAVLVERATATWCTPCAPGDEAFALFASQYGVDAPPATHREGYARPATPLGLLGLLGGLAAGLVLLWRRPE